MNLINYGDPEPDHGLTIYDRHGDEWTWDESGQAWVTPETMPFEWAKMRRAWFPMQVDA